jgi:hypothetical protein
VISPIPQGYRRSNGCAFGRSPEVESTPLRSRSPIRDSIRAQVYLSCACG